MWGGRGCWWATREVKKRRRRLRTAVDLIQASNFGSFLAVKALIKCSVWCDLSRAELQAGGSRPGTNVKLAG